MTRPLTKTERHLLDFCETKTFTWVGDRDHGLSTLSAKRALRSLERRGLMLKMPPSHSAPNTYWPIRPATGYTHCACRDCFDIGMDGKLCGDCQEAGCEANDGECLRDDAYGCEVSP